MQELKEFDWTRTREVVLSVDPERFPTGREAYEHVTRNKLIHNLVRNIERGKRVHGQDGQWTLFYSPVAVRRWKWFLEWHENGFPHWHVFLQVENQGKAGMIGGDRLRHYWGAGKWVYESFIKGPGHWKSITGYFSKRGYFESKGKHKTIKGHQGSLPEWAVEAYGNPKKIRRSCASVYKEITCEEFKLKQISNGEVIDLKTGEVVLVKSLKPKREGGGDEEKPELKTYKAILTDCGSRTKIKMWSDDVYGLFITERPYKEVRERIKGEYAKGVGYTFTLGKNDFNWLFDKVVRVIDFKNRRQKRDEFTAKMEAIHDHYKERGYWDYRAHFG